MVPNPVRYGEPPGAPVPDQQCPGESRNRYPAPSFGGSGRRDGDGPGIGAIPISHIFADRVVVSATVLQLLTLSCEEQMPDSPQAGHYLGSGARPLRPRIQRFDGWRKHTFQANRLCSCAASCRAA